GGAFPTVQELSGIRIRSQGAGPGTRFSGPALFSANPMNHTSRLAEDVKSRTEKFLAGRQIFLRTAPEGVRLLSERPH
ncbi:hypothetical protein, partial [Deinococcus wulumuqiensis]